MVKITNSKFMLHVYNTFRGDDMGFYKPKREEPEEVEHKDRIEISCLCWFYGDSESLPVMVKFRGPEGEIVTWRNIRVRFTDRKLYAGVLQIIYDCAAIVDGRDRLFKLQYYPGMSKWYMTIIN